MVTEKFLFKSYRDILIIFGAFLTFVPVFGTDDKSVKLLSLAYVFELLGVVISNSNLSSNFAFDFLQSESPFESVPTAFPMGVITYYFLKRKNWRWSIFSGLISLIAFKRIAFAAFFAMIAFDLFINAFRLNDKVKRVIAFSALTLILIISTGFAVFFNKILEYYFNTFSVGMSIDQFTIGSLYDPPSN